MKAKINGVDVEGTPEEMAMLLREMDGKTVCAIYTILAVYCPSYSYSPWTVYDSGMAVRR